MSTATPRPGFAGAPREMTNAEVTPTVAPTAHAANNVNAATDLPPEIRAAFRAEHEREHDGPGRLVGAWLNFDSGTVSLEVLDRVLAVHVPDVVEYAPTGDGTLTLANVDDTDSAMRWYMNGVERMLQDLRAARNMREGETDERGRGWEKICADVAFKMQRYALAMDIDAGDLLPQYLDAAPRGGYIDDAWLTRKWHSQARKARKEGPWPLPADFGASDPDRLNAIFTPVATTPASDDAPANPPGADLAGQILSEADSYLAQTVADRVLLGRYVYAPGLGWQGWTSARWEDVTQDRVTDVVSDFLKDYAAQRSAELTRQAASAGEELRAQLFKQIGALRALFSRSKITSVVMLARGKVEIPASTFDRHPHLLNVQNGVVDLRTGEVTPPDPELYMRRMAGAEYRPGYHHPAWDAALEALPTDVRPYLQMRFGQAATGETVDDDALAVLRGGGSNGKTTLLAGVQKALGEYATLVSRRALLTTPGQHPTELMDFMGARLAVMEELPEDHRLDVTRIKDTIGAPKITARRIAKDPVEFETTHTLFVTTNYLPQIDEVDLGTWRRLLLVEFPYTFRAAGQARGEDDRVGDPRLRAAVTRDPDVHAAALSWIVEGARQWYGNGRVMPAPPERIARDTLAWRRESDLLLAFLDDVTVPAPEARVLSSELLTTFNRWLGERNLRPWGDKTFAARIKNHEVLGKRLSKRRKRGADGLSRHPLTGGQPLTEANPNVWFGLRFLRIDEEGDNSWSTL